MKTLCRFGLLLGLFVGVLGLQDGVAQARTPTPTPTATPTAGMPASNQPMEVSGTVWVNAAPASATVQAFIGSTECASGPTVVYPDSYGTSFALEVPSSLEKAGCGQPGATVSFAVGGAPVGKTVVWQSGGYARVDLVVGPPFARYEGTFTYLGGGGAQVEALIDDVVCGEQRSPLLGLGPTWDFDIIVLPAELRPGCGSPGATV